MLGQPLDDEVFTGSEVGDGLLDDGGIDLQHLDGARHQPISRVVDVTVVSKLPEYVEYARLGPTWGRRRDAQIASDLVGGLESDAVDVERQAIGVLLDGGDGAVAVLLEYLHRQQRGDAMALQEDHHLPDLLLARPRLPDLGAALGADPIDLDEALGLGIDDVQRLEPKVLDQALGHDGADAFHHAGAQVLLDTHDRGRRQGRVRARSELRPVLLVGDPGPRDPQALARLHAEQVADDGHGITLAWDGNLHHRPGILLVGVGDALEDAFEGGDVLAAVGAERILDCRDHRRTPYQIASSICQLTANRPVVSVGAARPRVAAARPSSTAGAAVRRCA